MELQGILGDGEGDMRRFGVNERNDEDGLESPEEVVRGYISLAEGMRRVGDLNGAVASYLEALELLIDSQDNRTEVAEDVSDSDTAREGDDLDVVALMAKMDDFCREIAAPVLHEIYVPHHLAPQTLNDIRQLASAIYHNRRDIFGKADPETLESLRLLMMMLFVIGRWTDAIDHGREYLRLTSMITEHTDVHERMEVKRVLGLMLRELDATEQKEAQMHLDEVYRFRKDELGRTHEKTIRSLFDLSTVNESLDNLEDMVAMFEVVVDECIGELGEGHPRTLLCLSHLILLFDKVGREDDASDMQATLSQRLEEAREKRHGDLFLAMANQALFLVELEELDEAEAVYQRLTNLYSTSLSESHPDRIRIMEQYAQFMQSIGEVPSATEVRGRVVETLKKTLGPQHPQTLRSTFDLASCLGASSQFPQARTLLEEVVTGYQEMLGAECGKVVEALQATGVILVQLGELVQAREVHEQIVEKLTAKYGESDEKTIAAFVSLAGVIWSSGMETEGLAMEVKAIELQKSVLGPKHPTTLQTIHNHAVTLQSIGRYSTSLALLKEVHAARKDVLGDAHTHTIASLYSIAVSLEGLGQNEEAVKTVEVVVEDEEGVGLVREEVRRVQNFMTGTIQSDGGMQGNINPLFLEDAATMNTTVIAEIMRIDRSLSARYKFDRDFEDSPTNVTSNTTNIEPPVPLYNATEIIGIPDVMLQLRRSAEFTNAAYCSSKAVQDWQCGPTCDALGNITVFFTGGDNQLTPNFYVAYDPSIESVVLAQQGTDPTQILSLSVDADFGQDPLNTTFFTNAPPNTMVHGGFQKAFLRTVDDVSTQVQYGLSTFNSSKLLVTGHSLGAAISVMNGIYLTQLLGPQVEVTTQVFGLPRAGNSVWA
ncbi:9013_t:CDS:2 [Acaulospora colombiana]|uniref:9013_t:CDS:1 n=1 Tax=Acaulospora colombiana TaxID=27376 RepID=A0ACA9M4W4_9GLOM|nr:9013_t:CDS:2 [Acaulospora colombiana]